MEPPSFRWGVKFQCASTSGPSASRSGGWWRETGRALITTVSCADAVLFRLLRELFRARACSLKLRLARPQHGRSAAALSNSGGFIQPPGLVYNFSCRSSGSDRFRLPPFTCQPATVYQPADGPVIWCRKCCGSSGATPPGGRTFALTRSRLSDESVRMDGGGSSVVPIDSGSALLGRNQHF